MLLFDMTNIKVFTALLSALFHDECEYVMKNQREGAQSSA